MANTYSQCYFHVVFSPDIYKSLIDKSWSNNLEIFITSIVQKNGHKMIAIKCMSDHVHV
jgi:REP element-mobilizing transposase RayT